MTKLVIARKPQFIVALESKTAKKLLKWIIQTCGHTGWTFMACSFVGGAIVPPGYRAKVQYSALTFADDAYAVMVKLIFTDDVFKFDDYESGIRKTMVVKRGYQLSSHPNIDMWWGPIPKYT